MPPQNTRIFIVEDSVTQTEKLKSVLEINGFEVETATRGADALERIPQFKPEIVISDIVMPEMDGYEVCRRLKATDELKTIPFMLLTSLTEPEDVIRGLECGADQFLTKPWTEAFLVSRIKFILANRELRRHTNVSDMGMDIVFSGHTYRINSDRMQMLDLLLSTYENAMEKARELEKANAELKDALDTIKTMKDLVPICARCRKIRDDSGYWNQIEVFLTQHSITRFSHSYCPDCAKKILEEAGFDDEDEEPAK